MTSNIRSMSARSMVKHARFESIDKLIRDPISVGYLRRFAQSEHSSENLDFFIQTDIFRDACRQSSADKASVQALAQNVYNEFLSPRSPNEVSLDFKTRTQVEKDLQNGNVTISLFDGARRRAIETLRRDNFPRFRNSRYYRQLLERFEQFRVPRVATPLALDQFDIPSKSKDLRPYLCSQIMLNALLMYLQSKFCPEHLLFVRAVYAYQALFNVEPSISVRSTGSGLDTSLARPNEQAILDEAWNIYAAFLWSSTSTFCISPSSRHRKNVELCLARPTQHIFDDVLQPTLILLRADIANFEKSVLYRNALKAVANQKRSEASCIKRVLGRVPRIQPAEVQQMPAPIPTQAWMDKSVTSDRSAEPSRSRSARSPPSMAARRPTIGSKREVSISERSAASTNSVHSVRSVVSGRSAQSGYHSISSRGSHRHHDDVADEGWDGGTPLEPGVTPVLHNRVTSNETGKTNMVFEPPQRRGESGNIDPSSGQIGSSDMLFSRETSDSSDPDEEELVADHLIVGPAVKVKGLSSSRTAAAPSNSGGGVEAEDANVVQRKASEIPIPAKKDKLLETSVGQSNSGREVEAEDANVVQPQATEIPTPAKKDTLLETSVVQPQVESAICVVTAPVSAVGTRSQGVIAPPGTPLLPAVQTNKDILQTPADSPTGSELQDRTDYYTSDNGSRTSSERAAVDFLAQEVKGNVLREQMTPVPPQVHELIPQAKAEGEIAEDVRAATPDRSAKGQWSAMTLPPLGQSRGTVVPAPIPVEESDQAASYAIDQVYRTPDPRPPSDGAKGSIERAERTSYSWQVEPARLILTPVKDIVAENAIRAAAAPLAARKSTRTPAEERKARATERLNHKVRQRLLTAAEAGSSAVASVRLAARHRNLLGRRGHGVAPAPM